MPNSGHHIKVIKRRRRAPLLLRRSPWIILGIILCIALLHFIPALYHALSPVWPVASEPSEPPQRPEVIKSPQPEYEVEPPSELPNANVSIEEIKPPEVINIQKAIHENLAQPPGLKIDVYVTLRETEGCGGKCWCATLMAGDENFGTQEIFWNKELLITSISWNIPPNTEAFKQLQLHIPDMTVFQVSLEPPPVVPPTMPLTTKEAPQSETEHMQDVIKPTPEELWESLSQEERLEIDVIALVNMIREERGSGRLSWDPELYKYSKSHSMMMAEERTLFHSGVEKPYAENAWGGEGSKGWEALDIVSSWMNSPMHRTWLLCPHLKHIAVGIAYSDNGMYASWTFWRNETAYSDWWYVNTHGEPPDWWY